MIRKFTLLALCAAVSCLGHAQKTVDNAIVDVPASYPGGELAVLKSLAENLVYPTVAVEKNLQGTVVLKFRIDESGLVDTLNIKVEKSLSLECDQAAKNAVKKLDRFVPAKNQGQPVSVWFRIPVRFRVQE